MKRMRTAVALIPALAFVLVMNMPAEGVLDKPELNLGMEPSAERGYEILMNEPMAATVLQESDIENLWQVWEPEERAKAEAASAEERHRMTFERYGWAERIDDDSGLPLGYTADGKGNLKTNCFSCHGGKVAGETIPGAGNTHIDLTTLATDVMKLRAFESGGAFEDFPDVVAPFKTPLNHHKGFTNAVIFAPVFAALRDPKLAAEYIQHPELLKHHDMNPPAWWNFSKKKKLYADAFAPKTPRQLMPFAMSPLHSDEQFRSFEPNFVHIKQYIEELEPPKYPFPIDEALAAKGKALFERSCSDCHGTYGPGGKYPNKVVPIDRVGTDPVRLGAIDRERREAANAGWLQYGGEHPVDLESKGYLAQPLDGIWASAPYFHNGAVPTLHHLFNVDDRPAIWKRDENGYDQDRVG
jgi:mono/diheme cytochrome c family protein